MKEFDIGDIVYNERRLGNPTDGYTYVVRVTNPLSGTLSFKGVVLESDNEMYPIGYEHPSWNKTRFKFREKGININSILDGLTVLENKLKDNEGV